ncbi:MAG: ABC transporter permease [Chloroflexi bacterium]|nr:MAG: ABC transporter permease [Chloroflexota bacterium]
MSRSATTLLDPRAAPGLAVRSAVALSQKELFWRQFRRHKLALAASAVLLALAAMVLLASWIAPYPFDAIDPTQFRKPPSPAHIMGTDDIGRDLFTRLLYGGQISLAIGLFSALVGSSVGTLMGSLAGYYGRAIDNFIMRVTDVAFSIPSLPLLIILSSYAKSAIPIMILVIGLLSWMSTARIVRATVLSIRARDFTLAARSIGARDARILLRHILPNALAPIIVGATLGVGGAIIAESSLSFLGLGVQVPTPSWGNMLQDSQSTMSSRPWLTIFPGMAILITVLSINFLGDGLRDALDPTLRS